MCTRQPDGTVDMEPANLTRTCTLPAEKVSLPYCQNKQVARYHLYAKDNIQLPAGTPVEADLGYRIQIKPGLMVHTFAPAGLTGVQLVILPPYNQKISIGATICSSMVTRGPGESREVQPLTRKRIRKERKHPVSTHTNYSRIMEQLGLKKTICFFWLYVCLVLGVC